MCSLSGSVLLLKGNNYFRLPVSVCFQKNNEDFPKTRSTLKEKNLLLMEQILSLRIDPHGERRQNEMAVAFPECALMPFKLCEYTENKYIEIHSYNILQNIYTTVENTDFVQTLRKLFIS